MKSKVNVIYCVISLACLLLVSGKAVSSTVLTTGFQVGVAAPQNTYYLSHGSSACINNVSLPTYFDVQGAGGTVEADGSGGCAFENSKITISIWLDSAMTQLVGKVSYVDYWSSGYWSTPSTSTETVDGYLYTLDLSSDSSKNNYFYTLSATET